VKQQFSEVEAEVTAQIFVNNEPVTQVEGRSRSGVVKILWNDRDGVRWEGIIAERRLVIPDELVPEVAELRFFVPEARIVRRRNIHD
jgi:hypothetical protein